jgi:hypothetical protein
MDKGKNIDKSLFWDADVTGLDLQQNKEYIIERVLELGDEKAVRWLFSNYLRSEIRQVLTGSRRISRKSSNYWSLILNQ